MANYCNTKATLTGEPEDIQRLFEKIGENTDFHTENYQTLFESVDDVQDWGSKWQIIYPEYYPGDTMMFITGDSAWGPADGLWEKISREYNLEVNLEYSEPGMGFAGIKNWVDGELTIDNEMSYYEYLYQTDSDYFWEEIVCKCEYSPLDEVIDELGEIYENMDEFEKEKLLEIHSKKYSE